jgi:hypothetical protein
MTANGRSIATPRGDAEQSGTRRARRPRSLTLRMLAPRTGGLGAMAFLFQT